MLTVGIAWLCLRVFYWNGYYTEDSPGYVTDAIAAALRDYHARDNVNGLNVGTYLPVAIPLALFGKSEVALSIWPLLCSLLGMVSLAAAAAILFGPWSGVLAAALYATYPGDIFFATVVMPDSIQAGWLAFSMFLIVLALAGARDRRTWTLAAAGVAMGACHLVRANDVVLLPVGLAAVVLLSRLWRHEAATPVAASCVAYLAGWALVVGLEGMAYFWATGDFLWRVHAVTRHYGTLDSIRKWGLNIDPKTIPFSAFAPLAWRTRGEWGILNSEQAYHALVFTIGAVALVISVPILIAKRHQFDDRAAAGVAVAAVWFSWPLLVHQFGSQSLTEFVPMHRLSRHLVVYAPGAVFAAAAGWSILASEVANWHVAAARRLIWFAACALFLVHLYYSWQGEQIAYAGYHRIKSTYARIRTRLPPNMRTMIADPGDLCFFDFWLNPLGAETVRMMAFANYSRCDEMQSGVVLTQSNPGWEHLDALVIRETVQRLPCLVQPPATWRLVYDGHPEKVYEIEPGPQARP